MSRTKDNKRVMEVETLEERCTPAVLDLRTAGALGQVNGAIFEQVAAQPTGTEQGMYTDKFGHYEFDNLAVGLGGLSTYAVQEVVPDGYFAQDANSGKDYEVLRANPKGGADIKENEFKGVGKQWTVGIDFGAIF